MPAKKNYNKISEKPKTTVDETITEVTEETDAVVEEPKEETPKIPVFVKYKVNNCTKLNVRKKPSIDAAVVCIVDATNELTIEEIKSNDEWVKVCTESGKKGFCMKKFIAVK